MGNIILVLVIIFMCIKMNKIKTTLSDSRREFTFLKVVYATIFIVSQARVTFQTIIIATSCFCSIIILVNLAFTS